MKTTNKETQSQPLSVQDMQYKPLPCEADPKDIKIEVFMAAQKAKQKFKIRK